MEQDLVFAWCLKVVNSVSTELIVKISASLSELRSPRGVVKHFHLPGWLVAVSFCVMICIFIRIIIQTTWLQPDHSLSSSNLIQGLSKFYSPSQYLGYVHTLYSHLTPAFSLFVFDFQRKKKINVLFVIRDNSWSIF